jgi:hypothetical protein
MQTDIGIALRAQRWGILLSLLAIFASFALGGVFGAREEALKGGLKAGAEAVLEEHYGGDAAAAKKVTDKAWVYYKRAHLHWGAIGAATLAASITLALTAGAGIAARVASIAMGLGAVLYPLFWLLAGNRAPGLGGTGAAKASLEWLAVPASGAVLVGTALCLALVARALFQPRTP